MQQKKMEQLRQLRMASGRTDSMPENEQAFAKECACTLLGHLLFP